MDSSARSTFIDMTARDRHLRRRIQAATPVERLAAMRLLLERSRSLLESNPAGLDHFLRRNYKARSISAVDGRLSHGS